MVRRRRWRGPVLLLTALLLGGVLLVGAALAVVAELWPEPPGRVASLDDPDIPPGKVTAGAVEAVEGAHLGVVAVATGGAPDAYLGQECGGTVVAARWVLTAAHCVEGDPEDLVVHGGSVDLLSPDLVTVAVVDAVLHPDYVPRDEGLPGDLALLELAAPLDLPPVRLAGSDRWRAAGTEAVLLGWGGLAHDERAQVYPEVLVELPLPTVDDATCAGALGRLHRPGAHFCAGAPSPEGGADACRGDSGGPLFAPDGDGWVQIGIVSFGETCGRTYTAYTDVAAMCRFVTATTRVDRCEP